MRKRTKQILSFILACILCVGIFSVNTFAATGPTTGFKITQITVTPVVEANGVKAELKQYKQTKIPTGSQRSISMFWDSYKISGFNKYVIDNGYEMLGWNLSVTGTHTVAYEGTSMEDKLVSFEYGVDDNPTKTKDISYSKNRSTTLSWFAALPDELTDYNSLSNRLTCITTYRNGLSGEYRTVPDRVSFDMTYWPNYGV